VGDCAGAAGAAWFSSVTEASVVDGTVGFMRDARAARNAPFRPHAD
jgi:hypothetical protein